MYIEVAKMSDRIHEGEKNLVAPKTGIDREQAKCQVAAAGCGTEPFDLNGSAVVTGPEYSADENITDTAVALLKEWLKLPDLQVVNATRTPPQDSKPGIVKIEFKDTDTKMAVLHAKSQQGNGDQYWQVFIRSAQSHVERVSQKNTMAVLREMGLEDKFWFTGNGKLVPKQPTNPTVPTMAATGTPGPPPVGAPPIAGQFPPHTGMQQMAMNDTAPAPPFVYHGHPAQFFMT